VEMVDGGVCENVVEVRMGEGGRDEDWKGWLIEEFEEARMARVVQVKHDQLREEGSALRDLFGLRAEFVVAEHGEDAEERK
jgi:hypothetical protein